MSWTGDNMTELLEAAKANVRARTLLFIEAHQCRECGQLDGRHLEHCTVGRLARAIEAIERKEGKA